MRALSAKSGFLETSPNGLVGFSATHPSGAGFRSSLGMTARGKYKNSGNEAKNWLKTKDIIFLNAANYARFARQSGQIAA